MPQKQSLKSAQSGRLRIGNQWNAINIIARSQTHPLKAVCELVENAIDAKAGSVQIIRHRRQRQIYLEIVDDGNGVILDDDGKPDFARLATHVCDSMKRHLSQDERSGIHGEFGIGLLSFWSLGEQLCISSADQNGGFWEMTLDRGQRTYNVRPLRGHLAAGGTRVVVGPLLEATRTVVTGDKLQRYLSEELRDRIRATGVEIQIIDRVSRKELIVKPREFEGDRLDVPHLVSTPHGHLLVELYICPVEGRDDAVAVCKDGTRVLNNIGQLVHFQRSPWIDGRLEGVLDYPALTLSPGTRSGVVPDEFFQSFVSAVEFLEPRIAEAIERRDRAQAEKASRQILRQVHKAFVHALRDLPANEYLFFDIPQVPAVVPDASGNGAPTTADKFGVPVATGETPVDVDDGSGGVLPMEWEPGLLASVTISPKHPRKRPGEECVLTARAKDAAGIPIHSGVEFSWRVSTSVGISVKSEGDRCRIASNDSGQVQARVTAVEGEHSATAIATVKFLEAASNEDADSAKGLPSYRLLPEHGNPRRSRYDAQKNQIIINSAHRDFISSATTAAKHRRYIGKLYAKEVVSINFPHELPDAAMERLIEVLVRVEDTL